MAFLKEHHLVFFIWLFKKIHCLNLIKNLIIVNNVYGILQMVVLGLKQEPDEVQTPGGGGLAGLGWAVKENLMV